MGPAHILQLVVLPVLIGTINICHGNLVGFRHTAKVTSTFGGMVRRTDSPSKNDIDAVYEGYIISYNASAISGADFCLKVTNEFKKEFNEHVFCRHIYKHSNKIAISIGCASHPSSYIYDYLMAEGLFYRSETTYVFNVFPDIVIIPDTLKSGFDPMLYNNTTSPQESSSPPWHLDYLDHRIDDPSIFDNTYTPPDISHISTVYVADTGVRCEHDEFPAEKCNRLAQFTSSDGTYEYPCTTPNCARDFHGHGTLVSSLVNGNTVGIHSNISMHMLQVLSEDGTGAFSDVLSAIDVAIDHASNLRDLHPTAQSVVSLSLGCDCDENAMCSECAQRCPSYFSTVANDFFTAGNAQGIYFVFAAGNEGCDACTLSPFSAAENIHSNVIVAAASTSQETLATFSNYGDCVTLSAPGTDIIGAHYADSGLYTSMSGTSMSTPLIAGILTTSLAKNKKQYLIETAYTNNGHKIASLVYFSSNTSSNTHTYTSVPLTHEHITSWSLWKYTVVCFTVIITAVILCTSVVIFVLNY